jgi:hypothetical protein
VDLAGNQRRDVAALKTAVDVDGDDVGGAGVEHGQQRGQSAEGGPIADAGRHGDDGTIDESADDAG